MGDRYYIPKAKYAYCGAMQLEEVYYTPTSNFNIIKIEDITLDLIKEGFNSTTIMKWSNKKVDEICKDTLEQLQGKLK